jgi:hypothetical protein
MPMIKQMQARVGPRLVAYSPPTVNSSLFSAFSD